MAEKFSKVAGSGSTNTKVTIPVKDITVSGDLQIGDEMSYQTRTNTLIPQRHLNNSTHKTGEKIGTVVNGALSISFVIGKGDQFLVSLVSYYLSSATATHVINCEITDRFTGTTTTKNFSLVASSTFSSVVFSNFVAYRDSQTAAVAVGTDTNLYTAPIVFYAPDGDVDNITLNNVAISGSYAVLNSTYGFDTTLSATNTELLWMTDGRLFVKAAYDTSNTRTKFYTVNGSVASAQSSIARRTDVTPGSPESLYETPDGNVIGMDTTEILFIYNITGDAVILGAVDVSQRINAAAVSHAIFTSATGKILMAGKYSTSIFIEEITLGASDATISHTSYGSFSGVNAQSSYIFVSPEKELYFTNTGTIQSSFSKVAIDPATGDLALNQDSEYFLDTQVIDESRKNPEASNTYNFTKDLFTSVDVEPPSNTSSGLATCGTMDARFNLLGVPGAEPFFRIGTVVEIDGLDVTIDTSGYGSLIEVDNTHDAGTELVKDWTFALTPEFIFKLDERVLATNYYQQVIYTYGTTVGSRGGEQDSSFSGSTIDGMIAVVNSDDLEITIEDEYCRDLVCHGSGAGATACAINGFIAFDGVLFHDQNSFGLAAHTVRTKCIGTTSIMYDLWVEGTGQQFIQLLDRKEPLE